MIASHIAAASILIIFHSSVFVASENHVCQAHNFFETIPKCWPLKSNTKCQWCTEECNPLSDPMYNVCRKNEVCCLHECGTTCRLKTEIGIPIKAKKCEPKEPRGVCPFYEKHIRCPQCEDHCKEDEDCKEVGGGGRLCCPLKCGNRCVTPILF